VKNASTRIRNEIHTRLHSSRLRNGCIAKRLVRLPVVFKGWTTPPNKDGHPPRATTTMASPDRWATAPALIPPIACRARLGQGDLHHGQSLAPNRRLVRPALGGKGGGVHDHRGSSLGNICCAIPRRCLFTLEAGCKQTIGVKNRGASSAVISASNRIGIGGR